MGERSLRRGRDARGDARGASRRAGRARRSLDRGGGEHDGNDRRRSHGLAARPSRHRRPRPQLRDAVDRADVGRLRRFQHQHAHAVRQLPPDDRARRPHRGRVLGTDRQPGHQLGGVERDHPRVDHQAHHRRGGGAGGRVADPGRAGLGRPHGRRVRTGRRPRLVGRRPDRHVPRAAPLVADRRRGFTAAASCPAPGRAHRHHRAAAPQAGGDARPGAAPARREGARSHRVVGRTVGGGDARGTRRRRRARGIRDPPRRHALRRGHRCGPRQLVGLQRALPHLEHQQA